ncbi:hypothetical protein KDX32_32105, partial [Burkholderia ambifaria]|uniref:hypothetical protein n=1 Tax=Burkholderia ambifaria TaxID=152480 RepID=UPI001B93EE50
DDTAQAAAFLRPDSRRFAQLQHRYAVAGVSLSARQNELFRADYRTRFSAAYRWERIRLRPSSISNACRNITAAIPFDNTGLFSQPA